MEIVDSGKLSDPICSSRNLLSPFFFFFFFKLIILIALDLLCWLSLVEEYGATLRCSGFLCCRAQVLSCVGFDSCRYTGSVGYGSRAQAW